MKQHDHPLFQDSGLPEGPPVTPGMVLAAQEALNLRLPESYLEVLRACNGGPLRRTCLPTDVSTSWSGDFVLLRNLAGIGCEGGIDGAAGTTWLAGQWDYPTPCVVLGNEGRWALLLDYRNCPTGSEPPVLLVDSDIDEGDGIAEWRLAEDFGSLLERLEYRASRSQVAVRGDPAPGALMEAAIQAGAAPGPNPDHEGGKTLFLPGRDAAEAGPALVRISPNAVRPQGALQFPELVDCAWIVETNLVPDQAETLFGQLERSVTGEWVQLYLLPSDGPP
ncbi:MAG: SMI1/KNR4 family protein [Myxococcota bacterium]|nr:SMI1/KNR4 family protein [Myxococcota bacterium]